MYCQRNHVIIGLYTTQKQIPISMAYLHGPVGDVTEGDPEHLGVGVVGGAGQVHCDADCFATL